ncbi:MAG: hypothetical protein H6669_09525 [Ardenticatenaceae bacterium]|nr:hypothetical protein [Ardenticatenaceae bacterium]
MEHCPDCGTAVHASQRSTAASSIPLFAGNDLVQVWLVSNVAPVINPANGGLPGLWFSHLPGARSAWKLMKKLAPRAVYQSSIVCPTCQQSIAKGSDECPPLPAVALPGLSGRCK